MERRVGEGSGPSEVEEEEDAGGGEGDGEVVGALKASFPQVPEWGARPWMVVVGALRPPPREGRGLVYSGVGCVARIQACIPRTPLPSHLEALALETWEPRQQLQRRGTRSPLGWREGEGPFDLKPSPCRGQRAGEGAPSWGEDLG